MGLFKNKSSPSPEKKGEERIVRVCPRCKKPMPRSAFNVSGWFAPDEFACDKCGYTGHFFIEVDLNEVDLETLDEMAKNPDSPGEFDAEDEDKEEDLE